MSLADLRHHYTPERPVEERLRLLEVAATHLPAPEFLWLPVAHEALASQELSLRRAAMRLLAFAPQTWDQVLVAALTTADPELQRVALAALATQAKAWPELVEAYQALGELPGWLPESLAIWQQARAMLVPPPVDETATLHAELASVGAERERLAGRLAEAERERNELRETVFILNDKVSRLSTAAGELETSLESERRGNRDIALRLERAIAAHDADEVRWEAERGTHESLEKRHKLVMVGSAAVVALLVLVGGPVTWSMGSHKGAAAVAGTPVTALPAQMEEQLQSAEDAGYRRAVAQLASHAEQLTTEGHLYPAVAAWQAYSRLAPTPTEARHGVAQSDALLAKIQKGAPAGQFGQLAGQKPHATSIRRTALPVKRLTTAPRTGKPVARQAMRPAPAKLPPRKLTVAPPALPSPAGETIPASVRAKF